MHSILKLAIVSLLVCSSTLAQAIGWNMVQIDSFAREFEISLATRTEAWQISNLPTRHDVLNSLVKNLVIRFDGIQPTESVIKLQNEGGVIKIKVKTQVSREQTNLIAQISNPRMTISGVNIVFVPSSVMVPVASYLVASNDNQAAVIVSYILKALSIASGTLVLANSFCNVNGILLLKFIQMLDFINFFVLLNVNFREVIEKVFQTLYLLSQNTFLLFPIPVDFSSIPNQFQKSRGKLTQLKVSPVLLQNQLPETVFFFMLIFASLLFRLFRFGGISSKFSNFVNTMRFGYTQMILVEQFFYSLYQLTSSYNYTTFIPANIISYLGAFISLVFISNMLAEIWTQVREENFFAGTTIDELGKPLFKVSKIDTLTHIKEFISADIRPQKLRLLTARMYNPLFMMRLIVMCVSTLALQSYPFYQLVFMASYNLMLLFFTIHLALRSEIFESSWVSAQKIIQEFLINMIFVLFIVCNLDQSMFFLSLDAASSISFAVIIAIILSITVEFFFFSINFLRSIMLTYSNFKLYLFRVRIKDTRLAATFPKTSIKDGPTSAGLKKPIGDKNASGLESTARKITPQFSENTSPASIALKKKLVRSGNSDHSQSNLAVSAQNSPQLQSRVLKSPAVSGFANSNRNNQPENKNSSRPLSKVPFPKVMNNYFSNNNHQNEISLTSNLSTNRNLIGNSEQLVQNSNMQFSPKPKERLEAQPFMYPQKHGRTISVDQYNLIHTHNPEGNRGSIKRKDMNISVNAGKRGSPSNSKTNQNAVKRH
jgi:hypothetical protein